MLTISALAILINMPCYIYQWLLDMGIDFSFLHQPYHDFGQALVDWLGLV